MQKRNSGKEKRDRWRGESVGRREGWRRERLGRREGWMKERRKVERRPYIAALSIYSGLSSLFVIGGRVGTYFLLMPICQVCY